MSTVNADFSLQEILERERISIYYQPIVNLKTGTIFAYEALVRGLDERYSEPIQPMELFAAAERESLSAEFDRLCRKKALETYAEFDNPEKALIFMNINTSQIADAESESPHISAITHQMGFHPRTVGLELIESPSRSPAELINFVERFRESGYLIVIDDFGCEHSNIDRLIQIHPDIIKIDRNIISGIESDHYRQSILKSIHSLADMTGSLCLAEGVETLEELRTCHMLGVDLYQGFVIAHPAPDLHELKLRAKARVSELQAEIHRVTLDSLRQRRRLTGDINMLADWLIRQISASDPETLRPVFEEFIAMNHEIECVYILNDQGVQITGTIVSPHLATPRHPSLFAPALRGTNHAEKPFFTCFEALKVQRYLTDVYLSLASGNLCRTFSVRIQQNPASPIVLCIDFIEESIRTPHL